LGSGYVNNDVRISCFDEVTLGDDITAGERVVIRDSDNHQVAGSGPASTPVRIETTSGSDGRPDPRASPSALVPSSMHGRQSPKGVPANSLMAGTPAVVRKTDVTWT
jgi:hypothetical protein